MKVAQYYQDNKEQIHERKYEKIKRQEEQRKKQEAFKLHTEKIFNEQQQ